MVDPESTIDLAGLERPVALALSGGGAQGAAQAGAVVELIEAGMPLDMVIGTSVGAWNGAWVAQDPHPSHVHRLLALWTAPEIRRLFRGVRRGAISALARRGPAALADTRIVDLVTRTCGGLRLEHLPVPLAVGAVDLLTADLVYLDSGDLCDAVRAASAIPALLPPVPLGGRLLVDAGFVDSFGVVEALRRGARSIVLVDASVGDLGPLAATIPSLLERANLVTRIHQRSLATAQAASAGALLQTIEVAGAGAVLDFATAAAQIAHGRAAARARLRIAGRAILPASPGPGAPHPPVVEPPAAALAAAPRPAA